jgi:poly(hydroxyalkanoate) depolymerase family esterase
MQTRTAFASSLLLLAIACGSDDVSGTPSSDAGMTEAADQDTVAEAAPDSQGEDVGEAGVEADAQVTLERRTYSGSEGLRDYLLLRPGGEALPLVVVLHGCNQTAEGFAELTGFRELALAESFVALFPEQSGAANPWYCWNWFLDEHQRRESGEAAVVAAMVDEVIGEGGVDTSRVYAVGLSAGGALAVVLGTVFADKFAAVGSVEGCPFKGTPCINAPSSLTGDQLATLAHTAMGQHARALPVFVVQGDADTTVSPPNGDLLVEQWLGVADLVDNGLLDQSVSRDPLSVDSAAAGGKSYDILTYGDGVGTVVLRWTVQGLGHAWPGGAAGMAFSDPAGPSAAQGAWAFLSQHELP